MMKTFKGLIEIIGNILLFIVMIPLFFIGLLIGSIAINGIRFEDDMTEEFR